MFSVFASANWICSQQQVDGNQLLVPWVSWSLSTLKTLVKTNLFHLLFICLKVFVGYLFRLWSRMLPLVIIRIADGRYNNMEKDWVATTRCPDRLLFDCLAIKHKTCEIKDLLNKHKCSYLTLKVSVPPLPSLLRVFVEATSP